MDEDGWYATDDIGSLDCTNPEKEVAYEHVKRIGAACASRGVPRPGYCDFHEIKLEIQTPRASSS